MYTRQIMHRQKKMPWSSSTSSLCALPGKKQQD